MVGQLRIYKTKDGELNAFVQDRTWGVEPLCRTFEFTLAGAWVIPEEDRFGWILSLEGDRKAFEERHAAYHASPERKALQPDVARHRAVVEHWLLTSVLP